MKKLLLPLTLIALLISCKKEDVIAPVQKPEELAVRHTYDKSISTINYNQSIFDSCRNEYIALSGTETDIISTYDDYTGYYLRYEIDLTDITGIGENTGTIYTGGGKFVGTVKVTNKDTATMGKIDMKISYKSSYDEILYRQKARFYQIADKIKVEFNTGYLETCKLR